jgi:hypothetical protein
MCRAASKTCRVYRNSQVCKTSCLALYAQKSAVNLPACQNAGGHGTWSTTGLWPVTLTFAISLMYKADIIHLAVSSHSIPVDFDKICVVD